MSTLSLNRRGRAAAVLLSLLVAAPAVRADGPPERTETLDEVVIVGNKAKPRTTTDSPVPVDAFSEAALETALAGGEVGQALQALSPTVNLPRVSASGTSDAIRPIQLRGLAPDQVLVLVNGKRRHTSALLDTEGLFKGTVPVDLDGIPASAIERIEILRDGAGAQYGSDAVAGVVNVVLKETPVGGTVTTRYGQRFTHFDPTGKTLSDGQGGGLGVDAGVRLGEAGKLHLGVDLKLSSSTNRAGPAGDWSDNGSPADEAQVGKVLYRSGEPDQKGVAAWYDLSVPVAGVGEAYSFTTVDLRSTEGAAFYRWPGDASNVPGIYPDGYRPVTTFSGVDAGVVAGLKGDLAGIGWDVSLREGLDRVSYGVKRSLNSSLGAASPTTFHLATFTSNQLGLDADATRNLEVPGLAGPVVLAFGAQVAREDYATGAGDAESYAVGTQGGKPGAQAGPGLRPQDAVTLSRWQGAAYVEASSDVTRWLLLDLAGRYSRYGDFGGAATGKAAARVKLGDAVALRGSVSNSFRAPALAQTGFRFNTLNFDFGGTTLVNTAFLPPSDPIARAFGARELKPERSVNVTAGISGRVAGFGFSADAYQVTIKDRITRSSDLNSQEVADRLTALGVTDYVALGFLTNAIDSTARGVDLVASWGGRVAGGRLDASAALNLNRVKFDAVRRTTPELSAIAPGFSLLDDRDVYSLRHGAPDSKLVLSASWDAERWGLSAAATRYGKFSVGTFDDTLPLVEGAYVQRYGANFGLDAEVRVQPAQGVTVAVGGNNLLDVYPAQQASGTNLAGSLPYNYAAPIGINGRYVYARAAYRF